MRTGESFQAYLSSSSPPSAFNEKVHELLGRQSRDSSRLLHLVLLLQRLHCGGSSEHATKLMEIILAAFPQFVLEPSDDKRRRVPYVKCACCSGAMCGLTIGAHGILVPHAALVLHVCPDVELPVELMQGAGWITDSCCVLCRQKVSSHKGSHACKSMFARLLLADFTPLTGALPREVGHIASGVQQVSCH